MSPAHDDFDAEGRDRAMAGSPAGGLDLEQIAARLNELKLPLRLAAPETLANFVQSAPADIEALLAECRALRTALRPFAQTADNWPRECPNSERVGPIVTLGDLRQAQRLLNGETP